MRRVCVCPDLNMGVPTQVKKKKKKKKKWKKSFFLLRCQITGWKALAATKSGFDFMPQILDSRPDKKIHVSSIGGKFSSGFSK